MLQKVTSLHPFLIGGLLTESSLGKALSKQSELEFLEYYETIIVYFLLNLQL